jgi:hypothetical protein
MNRLRFFSLKKRCNSLRKSLVMARFLCKIGLHRYKFEGIVENYDGGWRIKINDQLPRRYICKCCKKIDDRIIIF